LGDRVECLWGEIYSYRLPKPLELPCGFIRRRLRVSIENLLESPEAADPVRFDLLLAVARVGVTANQPCQHRNDAYSKRYRKKPKSFHFEALGR